MQIHYLQLITAVMWGIICVLMAWSTVLTLIGRARHNKDEWRSVLFFISLLMVGFPSRWLIAPADVDAWRVLYFLSILLAVYVLLLLWNGKGK